MVRFIKIFLALILAGVLGQGVAWLSIKIAYKLKSGALIWK